MSGVVYADRTDASASARLSFRPKFQVSMGPPKRVVNTRSCLSGRGPRNSLSFACSLSRSLSAYEQMSGEAAGVGCLSLGVAEYEFAADPLVPMCGSRDGHRWT